MDRIIKCLEDVRDILDEYLPEDADDVDKLLREYIFLVCNYYKIGYNEPSIESKKKAFIKFRDKLTKAIDNI